LYDLTKLCRGGGKGKERRACGGSGTGGGFQDSEKFPSTPNYISLISIQFSVGTM